MTSAFVLTLALMQVPGPQGPDSAFLRTAYLDSTAKRIVELSRGRRERVDRSITRYTTRATERISLGVSALRRDRLFYRREFATRIDWRRDSTTVVEIEGAREVVPVAFRGMRVPEDLRDAGGQAFDPAADRMAFFGDDPDSFIHHPLAAGAERHYRYRAGDTTQIRLQDGRTLRLLSLEVLPRQRTAHHVTGTMWMEADTHAPVRFIFRLAQPFDFIRDADPDDREDVPGWLPSIRADMEYLTVEYGLWELRWWMPRLIALKGSAEVGFVRFPLEYERRYDAYTVEGDPDAPPVPRDTVRAEPSDSMRAACREDRNCRCTNGTCRTIEVRVPLDTASLMFSDRLPGSPYDQGESLLTEAELRGLGDALRANMPEAPWQVGVPTFSWGLRGQGSVRYNRIEALSLGGGMSLDFGRLEATAGARLGVADLEPNGWITLSRTRGTRTVAATGYRRLEAMNPELRPLAFGNSFNSLVFGRDDGEYYRTLGAEFRGSPSSAAGSRTWEWRVFHERQEAAAVETDFSIPHIFKSSRAFRPNRPAADAVQTGAGMTLRWNRGLDPDGFRWGGEIQGLGSTGTFDFVRGALTLRAGLPLGFGPSPAVFVRGEGGGGFVLSAEVAAGTTGGDAPLQSHWYLGGPATVRGYHGATAGGESFWRGRVEVGTALPAARLALFADAGWVGPRDRFETDPMLASVGIGGSMLDGLLRLDLARALKRPTGWRLDLYLDGLL
jgi:hypothetical protein